MDSFDGFIESSLIVDFHLIYLYLQFFPLLLYPKLFFFQGAIFLGQIFHPILQVTYLLL